MKISQETKNFLVESLISTAVIATLWKSRKIALLSKESLPYAYLATSYVAASALFREDPEENRSGMFGLIAFSTAALGFYKYYGAGRVAKSIIGKHLWISIGATGSGIALYHSIPTRTNIDEVVEGSSTKIPPPPPLPESNTTKTPSVKSEDYGKLSPKNSEGSNQSNHSSGHEEAEEYESEEEKDQEIDLNESTIGNKFFDNGADLNNSGLLSQEPQTPKNSIKKNGFSFNSAPFELETLKKKRSFDTQSTAGDSLIFSEKKPKNHWRLGKIFTNNLLIPGYIQILKMPPEQRIFYETADINKQFEC